MNSSKPLVYLFALLMTVAVSGVHAEPLQPDLASQAWKLKGSATPVADGIRLEATPDAPAIYEAPFHRLLNLTSGSQFVQGTIRFEYRGTSSPDSRSGYGAVSVMPMGDTQHGIGEIPGRRWIVLADADPEEWKIATLKFDFDPGNIRGIVLRFSCGLKEITDTLEGDSALEIRNVTISDEF